MNKKYIFIFFSYFLLLRSVLADSVLLAGEDFELKLSFPNSTVKIGDSEAGLESERIGNLIGKLIASLENSDRLSDSITALYTSGSEDFLKDMYSSEEKVKAAAEYLKKWKTFKVLLSVSHDESRKTYYCELANYGARRVVFPFHIHKDKEGAFLLHVDHNQVLISDSLAMEFLSKFPKVKVTKEPDE